jgi:hypothetical protein
MSGDADKLRWDLAGRPWPRGAALPRRELFVDPICNRCPAAEAKTARLNQAVSVEVIAGRAGNAARYRTIAHLV